MTSSVTCFSDISQSCYTGNALLSSSFGKHTEKGAGFHTQTFQYELLCA